MIQETVVEATRTRANDFIQLPDATKVREQLQRILENPLFQTSKRYPSVLKYLVDRALEGIPEGHLKERMIGIEVLGREPTYDTNQDPSVRVVAGEIRKRLLSYYAEPHHAHEVRIDLPIGSYTPRFSFAEPSVAEISTARKKLRWGAMFALLLAVSVIAGYLLVHSRTALDRFWAPVIRGSPPLLFCVGQQTAWGLAPQLNDPLAQQPDPPTNSSVVSGSENSIRRFFSTQPYFSLMTLTAVTNIASFLRPKSGKELIRASGDTSLADLRQGPAVLIGSFSNYWIMHFNESLRFRFRRSNEQGLNWIEDRDDPSKRDWAVKVDAAYTDVTEEYAIITRARDASTGQIFVSAGGVTAIGTVAASEFLVNTAGWEVVAQHAPKGWEQKNLQVVIGVNVVNGNAGAPRVLATYFW